MGGRGGDDVMLYCCPAGWSSELCGLLPRAGGRPKANIIRNDQTLVERYFPTHFFSALKRTPLARRPTRQQQSLAAGGKVVFGLWGEAGAPGGTVRRAAVRKRGSGSTSLY